MTFAESLLCGSGRVCLLGRVRCCRRRTWCSPWDDQCGAGTNTGLVFFLFFCFVFLSVCFFTPFSFTPHKPPFKRRFITKYQKKIAFHLTQPLRGTEGLSKLPGDTQKSGKVTELGFEPASLKVHSFSPIPKPSQSC